jgi:hypothetical protein
MPIREARTFDKKAALSNVWGANAVHMIEGSSDSG